jgi:hypothetical protein
MNFAPLYGAIAATAAIRRTSEERRKYEEGLASRRHQATERFEQLEDEAGQSVDELRTKQQDIDEARLNEIFPPIKTDNQQHPVAPPPELVTNWLRHRKLLDPQPLAHHYLASRAAQWGADQELEACCEWLDYNCPSVGAIHLRTARRPKPPSLKEQALAELEKVDMLWDTTEFGHETLNSLDTIRRALEALPND